MRFKPSVCGRRTDTMAGRVSGPTDWPIRPTTASPKLPPGEPRKLPHDRREREPELFLDLLFVVVRVVLLDHAVGDRNFCISVTSSRRPVGGRPKSSPSWVAVNVSSVMTIHSRETTSLMAMWKSGNARAQARMYCSRPSGPWTSPAGPRRCPPARSGRTGRTTPRRRPGSPRSLARSTGRSTPSRPARGPSWPPPPVVPPPWRMPGDDKALSMGRVARSTA